jgi:hypothetical protein
MACPERTSPFSVHIPPFTCCRLPQLRRIAPEFYNQLTSYPTWAAVIWKFITDPQVGARGVMTKRVMRTGGSSGAAAAHLLTPASAMPLLRGILPGGIH